MKHLFSLLLLAAAGQCFAQIKLVDATKLTIKDSFLLKQRVVTDITTDTLFASPSDKKLPSQKAVKIALDKKSDTSHKHDASAIQTGVIDPHRLGTGTADSTHYLTGNGIWSNLAHLVIADMSNQSSPIDVYTLGSPAFPPTGYAALRFQYYTGNPNDGIGGTITSFGGNGASRGFGLIAGGIASRLTLGQEGAPRWLLSGQYDGSFLGSGLSASANNGHFVPFLDSTYDIGGGAKRVRNIYMAGSLTASRPASYTRNVHGLFSSYSFIDKAYLDSVLNSISTSGGGGITSETDPNVSAAAKAISAADVTNWNGKQGALTTTQLSNIDLIPGLADTALVIKGVARNADSVSNTITTKNGTTFLVKGKDWTAAIAANNNLSKADTGSVIKTIVRNADSVSNTITLKDNSTLLVKGKDWTALLSAKSDTALAIKTVTRNADSVSNTITTKGGSTFTVTGKDWSSLFAAKSDTALTIKTVIRNADSVSNTITTKGGSTFTVTGKDWSTLLSAKSDTALAIKTVTRNADSVSNTITTKGGSTFTVTGKDWSTLLSAKSDTALAIKTVTRNADSVSNTITTKGGSTFTVTGKDWSTLLSAKSDTALAIKTVTRNADSVSNTITTKGGSTFTVTGKDWSTLLSAKSDTALAIKTVTRNADSVSNTITLRNNTTLAITGKDWTKQVGAKSDTSLVVKTATRINDTTTVLTTYSGSTFTVIGAGGSTIKKIFSDSIKTQPRLVFNMPGTGYRIINQTDDTTFTAKNFSPGYKIKFDTLTSGGVPTGVILVSIDTSGGGIGGGAGTITAFDANIDNVNDPAVGTPYVDGVPGSSGSITLGIHIPVMGASNVHEGVLSDQTQVVPGAKFWTGGFGTATNSSQANAYFSPGQSLNGILYTDSRHLWSGSSVGWQGRNTMAGSTASTLISTYSYSALHLFGGAVTLPSTGNIPFIVGQSIIAPTITDNGTGTYGTGINLYIGAAPSYPSGKNPPNGSWSMQVDGLSQMAGIRNTETISSTADSSNKVPPTEWIQRRLSSFTAAGSIKDKLSGNGTTSSTAPAANTASSWFIGMLYGVANVVSAHGAIPVQNAGTIYKVNVRESSYGAAATPMSGTYTFSLRVTPAATGIATDYLIGTADLSSNTDNMLSNQSMNSGSGVSVLVNDLVELRVQYPSLTTEPVSLKIGFQAIVQ